VADEYGSQSVGTQQNRQTLPDLLNVDSRVTVAQALMLAVA
jgi:hypothetical protein